MNKTTVMVEFSIYGENFIPEEISKIINIVPTETRSKGIIPKGKNKPSIETSWSLAIKAEESFDINNQLKKLIKILENKEIVLLKILEDYNIQMVFEIVINIENNEKPAIYFEPDILKFISSINATIDIDLYILS